MTPPTSRRVEGAAAVAYFAAYLGYLWLHPESERAHWVTLVVLPLAGLAAFRGLRSPRALLATIGLSPAGLHRGWRLVLPLALGFQALQLLNRPQRAALGEVCGTPLGLLLPLGAVVLLLGTAATTEEVFFRGIFQSRLADAFRSDWLGFVAATLAFALYHVPYAYLVSTWPSAGDLGAALRTAMANGLVGGVPLGFVFWRSGRNLAAVMVLHAAIDLIPATVLLGRLLEP